MGKIATDLQQSVKLSKILPLESADMYYYCGDKNDLRIGSYKAMDLDIDIPAWSLDALMACLPYGYSSILTKSFNGKDYYCTLDGKPFASQAETAVDACCEFILKLHELEML